MTKLEEIETSDELTSQLFAICAHVIRVYKERAYGLNTITTDVCSENDYIFKLWGETISAVTTELKKLSRAGEKNVIGLKVDCRAVAYFERSSKEVDIMNMEAARKYEDSKIYGDRAKLVAEVKCAVDYFLNSPTLSKEKKDTVCIPLIQIAGSKCEVCSYQLVADGLYALNSIGFLSVPSLCTEFSSKSFAWFKLLLRLKCMITDLYDLSILIEEKNTGDFDGSHNTSLPSTCTRGTFFPLTEASSNKLRISTLQILKAKLARHEIHEKPL